VRMEIKIEKTEEKEFILGFAFNRGEFCFMLGKVIIGLVKK